MKYSIAAPGFTADYTFRRSISMPKLIAVLALIVMAQGVAAADWYVDGANGLDTNTGTSGNAFQTPWKAWTMAGDGDVIHLMPTTVYGPLWFGPTPARPKTGGSASGYITIRGTGSRPNLTKISGKGENFGLMLDQASYIRIQNLDITAPGHGTRSGWSGVYLKYSHHIDVQNNYVHDAGCSGIQTHHADYIRVVGNRVADNAKVVHNNVYCSGISQHENLDIDTNTGTKMEISHNIVHGNTNIKPSSCTAPCTNSDGNGIIIDDSRRRQTDSNAYIGATRIDNNVVFGNGGRGLSIYQSDNVTARGNTFFHNNQDPDLGAWRPGDVHVNKSGGVKLYTNIFFSAGLPGTSLTGAHVAMSVQNSSGNPVIIDYNLSFNPQNDNRLHLYTQYNASSVKAGTRNKWADPLHHTPSRDPAYADFRVLTTSPALGYKSPTSTYPTVDYLYTTRKSPVTVGAYQIPVRR